MALTASTDDIFEQLKPLGRIQQIFLGCMVYLLFFMPMLDQSVVFLAATPDHHCTVRDGYYVNQTIPVEETGSGEWVYAQCEEYVDPDNPILNGTQECQEGWQYSDDVYGETIITEWNLVCQPNPASEVSQSILQIGGMGGALLLGPLADVYGRRPTLISTLILYDVTMLAISFSPNYLVFLVLRLLAGFSQMGAWVAFSCIGLEYMIPKYRNIAINVPQIAVSCGLMFMALLAFLIRDWRFLQLAMHIPTMLGSCVVFFLPESLRWLISKDRKQEAGVLIRKLAKINGTEVPSCTYTELERVDEKEGKLSSGVTSGNGFVNGALLYSPDGQEKSTTEISPSGGMAHPTDSHESPSSNPEDVEQKIPKGGHFVVEIADSTKSSKTIEDEQKYEVNDENHTAEEVDRQENDTEESKHHFDNSQCNGDVKQDDIQAESTNPKTGTMSYLDLFKPPVLHVTAVISIFRFSFTMVYFGFALNTGQLAGDPYLNFFFSALVEVPAKILSPFLYNWFRRTYIVSSCFGGCFVALAAMIFIPDVTKSGAELGTVLVVLSLIGKFFVTLALGGMLLLVMELFPTTLRNMGNGWTLCMGRLGGICAPFILYADAYIPSFSTIVMAVMSFVTAATVLTLPDTRKTAQPQNSADLKQMFRGTKDKKTESTDNNAFEDDSIPARNESDDKLPAIR